MSKVCVFSAGLFLTMLGCGCMYGQAANPAPAQRLYLLAATPTENIGYGTNRYPATLYRANSAKKLDTVREIVSEKDGSAAVQAVGNTIFVVGGSNFTVYVIHTNDPTRSDSAVFNAGHPGAGLDLQGGLAAAAVQESAPDILIPMSIPVSGSPSTRALVSVSSGLTGAASRIQLDNWDEYGALRRDGTPGMPILALPFVSRVDGSNVVYNLTVHKTHGSVDPKPIVIDSLPPSLRGTKAPVPVAIEAANAEYLVLRPIPDGALPQSTTLAHNRARDIWQTVDIEGDRSRLRLFGQWLATDVEQDSSGPFADDKPEKSGERDSRTSRLPNVYGEYGAYCWMNRRRFPGILVLQNLADGRKIRMETHQEDSEILWVGADTLVYRVNDSIYRAAIAGDKIQGATLLVKDDDVPEVHWVFWAN